MPSTRQILRHKAHQMKLRIRLWEVFWIFATYETPGVTLESRKVIKIAALSHNSLWQHLLFWHSPDALENLRTTPIGDNHFLWRTKHFGGRRGWKKWRRKEKSWATAAAAPGFSVWSLVCEGDCQKALLSDRISLWWVVWLFKCPYRCALAIMALNYTDRVIFIK